MLNSDFKDILSTFLAAKVEFLVVGAYALAAHGIPRATGDIDLWVRPDVENARRVHAALAAFGAPMKDIDASTFTEPDIVFQIGVEPNRIDILTAIDGISFDDAVSDKIEVHIEGLAIPVLSRRALICNKRASDRAKDRVDIELLEKGRA